MAFWSDRRPLLAGDYELATNEELIEGFSSSLLSREKLVDDADVQLQLSTEVIIISQSNLPQCMRSTDRLNCANGAVSPVNSGLPISLSVEDRHDAG